MPHWMIHPDHGVNPVYDHGEKQRSIGLGWKLLNSGESPDHSRRDAVLGTQAAPAPAVPTPSLHDQVGEAPPVQSSDILDQVVVAIVPQLQGKSLGELEALRAREQQGKARKGLISLLNDAISTRKG